MTHLDIARCYVVDDDETANPFTQRLRRNVHRCVEAFLQHQPKLNFVIEQLHMGRTDDIGISGDNAGRGFGEEDIVHNMGWVTTNFTDMVSIVCGLTDEFCIPGYRAQEACCLHDCAAGDRLRSICFTAIFEKGACGRVCARKAT